MSRERRDPIPNNIDKLLLIKLVNERPILWDITADSYQCRILKKAAWQEVCGFLNKDYGKLNATEKLKFYNAIIKIWRHIRVTWRRSVNARAKGRKTGIVVRPYKYHQEMLFLRKLPNIPNKCLDEESDIEEEQAETKTFEENESENEFENESNVDAKEEINVTVVKQEINTYEHDMARNRDTIYVPDTIDAKMTAYIDNRMKQMTNPSEILQDRHYAFFKSVHPTLTLLNDDQILEFQSGVINLLQDIKSGGRFNSFTNDQPSSSGYYSQPEVSNVSRQPLAGSRVLQISSGEARRIQPKMSLDPLI